MAAVTRKTNADGNMVGTFGEHRRIFDPRTLTQPSNYFDEEIREYKRFKATDISMRCNRAVGF
jgi:hypothetical protein